ncbi:hypothetical protein V6N13_100243 [Hibiscus sabdariffa]
MYIQCVPLSFRDSQGTPNTFGGTNNGVTTRRFVIMRIITASGGDTFINNHCSNTPSISTDVDELQTSVSVIVPSRRKRHYELIVVLVRTVAFSYLTVNLIPTMIVALKSQFCLCMA